VQKIKNPIISIINEDKWRQHASKIRFFAAAVLIVAVCIADYSPAMKAGFIWNDDSDLIENTVLKGGGLYRSWFTTAQPNYWPITWTSYWLEHKLWELNPAGYHIINILIHAACALLIWRILLLLKIPAPWLAALVFAVHPVNVESVAWITQRKTLLAMLFFLMSLLLYLKFENSNKFLLYWLSAGTFVLAMLSKGSVVALPVVLLLIVWWRHGTITRKDLLRSIPFFAISAVMSCVEIWFQYNRVIAAETIRSDNFFARLAGAGMAVWFYIYKAVLPANLIFVYPRWQINPEEWLVYVPFAALTGLFLLLLRYRQSWAKSLLFALSYYVVMLLPVLGFFSIYFMKYSLVADHYQYAAIIGMIALVVSAGYFIAVRLGRWGNIIAKTAAVVILALLATLTWRQCRIYKDVETLWSDVLLKNPDSWIAHNDLGIALQSKGRLDEAMAHYRHALQFRTDAEVYNNIGNLFTQQGKTTEAAEYYLKALRANPDYINTYYNMGKLFQIQGKTDAAIDCFRQAVRRNPGMVEAHYSLALALQTQGKLDEALDCYRRALQLKPGLAEAYNNIGTILAVQGRLDEAIEYFQQALKFRPDYPKARQNLINTLKQQQLLKNTKVSD